MIWIERKYNPNPIPFCGLMQIHCELISTSIYTHDELSSDKIKDIVTDRRRYQHNRALFLPTGKALKTGCFIDQQYYFDKKLIF